MNKVLKGNSLLVIYFGFIFAPGDSL